MKGGGITKALLVATVLFVSAVVLPAAASAQGFTFIEPLPETDTALDTGTLAGYIQNVFWIALGAAALLAVLILVIGGVRYVLTSVNPSEKEAAKRMIWGAIGGLFLVLAGWLVLLAINPDLVNFSLIIEPIISEGFGTARTAGIDKGRYDKAPPATFTSEEQTMRGVLGDVVNCGGIEINNVHECKNPYRYDQDGTYIPVRYQDFEALTAEVSGSACPPGGCRCTSVRGLPDNAVNGICAIGRFCVNNLGVRCVHISGGTEAGHKTHGEGKPVLDALKDSDLTDLITDTDGDGVDNLDPGIAPNPERTANGFLKYTWKDGTVFLDEGTHWHIVFP